MPVHKLQPVRRAFALATVFLGGTAGFAQSPIPNPFGGAPPAPERGGFYLYNAALFGQYSSSVMPVSAAYAAGNARLEGDGIVGGAVGLGWRRPAPKGDISVFYNPSYTGMAHHSALNALNQTLSVSASRRLAARWYLSLSAAAGDNSIAQFLFTPALLGNVAAAPATAAGLSAALNGIPKNAQLASLLGGASAAESPARAVLYGNRVLTTTGRAGLNYAWSPRLSLRLGFTMQRFEDRPDRSASRRNALLSKSVSGAAEAAFVYLLTPRTQTGVTLAVSRNVSRLQDAYIGTASAFVSRTLSRHWFAQAQGGAGTIAPARQLYPLSTGLKYIAGGSLGYRRREHTFIASVHRLAGDAYAYGAGSTLETEAAWNWRRPGSGWVFFGSFGRQRFFGSGSRDAVGWLAAAGLSRALSAQMALQAQYAFMNNFLSNAPRTNSVSAHSVRVAVVWSPVARLWR